MCAEQDRDIAAWTLGVGARDDVGQSLGHTIMKLLDGFA